MTTFGEEFSKLIEHLRLAQEAACMIGHLDKEQGDNHRGEMWLIIGEKLKIMVDGATRIATARAN